MKIAVAQVSAGSNKQKSLDKALLWISRAKEKKADFVVFPEAFMMSLPRNSTIKHTMIAETLNGPFVQSLARAAHRYQIHVACGIYEKKEEDKKHVYNTIILLDDMGTLIHHYRKIHLYDAFHYKESENIAIGDRAITPVRTKFGTLGFFVCYELRFPEISRTLVLKGADILVVPTAWVSGILKEDHLLTLSRARALENTVFVCIANQVGAQYIGRSIIWDPMGVTLASIGEEEGLIFAKINFDRLNAVREELPCLQQRHPTLYQLEENVVK